jgi:putative PIG3 family NAD(P)H quinone oxidoreductase
MKAAVITKPGGVEVLEIRDVPAPQLTAPDSVLVRVRAAGLNRADILQRMGRYPAPAGAPKDIPGMEFAGEVAEIGQSIKKWKPGDRVFGITGGGAQAEYIVTPADHLAAVPENLDWAQAAAVPEVFITAHDALFTQAGLKSGETLLVHAAGSGVGTAAIQLARAAGARVFGTARSEEKLSRAKELGLDASLTVKDDTAEVVSAILEWTNRRGVDVVLDLVGARYLESNLKSLGLKGRMILVGTTSGSQATLDFGVMLSKRLTLRGTVLRARSDEEKAEATRLFAEQVVPLLAARTVRPIVDQIYTMSQVREAHQRMESNANFGKIVLLID